MIDRVILPLDGTDASELAIEHGAAIARRFNAPVTLLRTYDAGRILAFATASSERWGGPDAIVSPIAVQAVADAIQVEERQARDYLDEWARILRSSGLTVDVLVQEGPAKLAILEATSHSDRAIVMMGARKHGWLRRLLFGSTADTVLRQSDAPVMVIHPDERPVPARRPHRPRRLRRAVRRAAGTAVGGPIVPMHGMSLRARGRG